MARLRDQTIQGIIDALLHPARLCLLGQRLLQPPVPPCLLEILEAVGLVLVSNELEFLDFDHNFGRYSLT